MDKNFERLDRIHANLAEHLAVRSRDRGSGVEKDRQCRYETANGLAADLKRHLENKPVLARPPSAAYKFRKAYRRNKGVFTAGTAVAFALVFGVIVSAWQAVRATPAEALALDEKALAEKERANALVEKSNAQAALRVQRDHLGASHLETLRSLNGLALARWWGGETSLAEPLSRKGLEASRRALGEKHPLTLQFMQTQAFVLMLLAEASWAEVESRLLQTLSLHREVLGPDDPATLQVIYGIGLAYYNHFKPENAEPFLVDALARSRRVLGEQHPTTSGLTAGLAAACRMMNQLDRAEILATNVVQLRRRTLGEDHPLTLLATVHVMQYQLEQAAPYTDQALAFSRPLPLEKSPLAGIVKELLANGANASLVNNEHQAARMLAESAGHREVAKLLKAPAK